MTLAINYESESHIVETDAQSRLALDVPHRKYVQIVEADGAIRLVPLDLLHESERAILENQELYQAVRRGLSELAQGESVSSDWLFADE